MVNLSSPFADRADLSPATCRAYDAAWRAFDTWARSRGLLPLPAPLGAVELFIHSVFEGGAGLASANMARAAIAAAHRSVGLEVADAGAVGRLIRHAGRVNPETPRQAAPLTASALATIAAGAHVPRRSRGGRLETPAQAERRGNFDVALAAVMRDALLRISEAAALVWGNVSVQDGAGYVDVLRTKTNFRQVCYLGPPTVAALELIRPEHPDPGRSLFGLRPGAIATRITRMAQEAGLGAGFSGHSPRVGMAQDLAAAGVDMPALMLAGGWRESRSVARYTAHLAASRGAVAQFYSH